MLEKIKEAEGLFEKSEKESAIAGKGFLIEEAMDILDKYLDDEEFGEMARNIKEKHIKIFLDQLVELPILDGGDVMDVMEMVECMGEVLFDIVENDMEAYKSVAEKLGNIFLNYERIVDGLIKWQRDSKLRSERWRRDFEQRKLNSENDDPIV